MKQSHFCILCLTIVGAPHLNEVIAAMAAIMWTAGFFMNMYLERND